MSKITFTFEDNAEKNITDCDVVFDPPFDMQKDPSQYTNAEQAALLVLTILRSTMAAKVTEAQEG